jgi:hypothetical protein
VAITVKNTADLGGTVKVIVYSDAGIGKTRLCATAPNPLIISTENGLLSLQEFGLPFVVVNTVDELEESFDYAVASSYSTICLDSISDIAESILLTNKQNVSDGRQAYGKLNDLMHKWITKFRNIEDKHVYFTAKQGVFTDDYSGITSYRPMMPGKTNQLNLPFYFDELFCLRIGVTEKGKKYRYLQTQPDISYAAKDRSGKLNQIEKPNLTHIFEKIQAKKTKEQKSEVEQEREE